MSSPGVRKLARVCRSASRRWRAGWTALLDHRDVPGYRDLCWCTRAWLDHRAAWGALATRGFWRIAFCTAASVTFAQILIWQHDLSGWQRDLLYSLPAVMAAPWMARGRRRQLRRLVRRPTRTRKPANPGS